MRSVLFQSSALVVLALLAAGITWRVKGPPQRTLSCDEKVLKPGEVCLTSVHQQSGILWIDARSRADWSKNGHPDAVLWNLDPAEDAQAMEATVMNRLMDARLVVIYCSDDSCGTSHQVAARVRQLGVAPDVVVLFGGWRALKEAGMVKDSN